MIYMTYIYNMLFFLLKINNPSIGHPVWPLFGPRLDPHQTDGGLDEARQKARQGQTECPMGAMSSAMSFLNAMSFV
jgi:hypothetical protein